MSTKTGRQNKVTEKTPYHILWVTENYDFLLREARKEGIAVAVYLNRLVREIRLRADSVPQGKFPIS